MRNIMEAFMDESLSPEERVQKMWYSIFLVRLWRQYVVDSETLALKDNFLTHNCYTCLELNAHSLVLSLLHLKKSNKEHWFVPTHYNSQPCEHFYRQIRSFSTVFSTVTNCSTKEAISRVKKIQLQSDISISNTVFKFPRFLDLNGSSETNSFALPTQEKMIEIIEDCQKRAINDATNIGLLKEPVLEIPCDIIPYRGRSNMKNIKKKWHF